MLRKFFIRLRNWEYWPLYVVYIPVYIYYILLSIRSWSFFYFTASNPGIENGGMLGESKIKILENLEKKPITFFTSHNTSIEEIEKGMEKAGLKYPIITKPDIGERGWGVSKIHDALELQEYLEWAEVDFLVQEYIGLPLEAGVFYHRFPGNEGGKITSIAFKEMLYVTGNGVASLKELIYRRGRAFLQWDRLKIEFADRLESIIPLGERIDLGSIGNHSLGTKFIDATDLVDYEMVQTFNEYTKGIEGFYFGRFDLRCKSLTDLRKGNFVILELNGAGAEPAHIYEPGYSLLKGQSELLKHMKIMWQISRANHKLGVPYMDRKTGWEKFKEIRRYNKTYKQD